MEEQDSNIENIQEAIIQNDEKQIKQKKIKLIALVVSIITVISVVATILLNNLINASGDSLMYVPTRVKITFEDGSISYTSIKYNSKGFIEKIDYQDDSVKFEYDKNGNITKAIYDSILIGGDWTVEYLYKDGLLIEKILKEEFTDWKGEQITRYCYNEKGECVLETLIRVNQHIQSHSYQYDENGRIKRETYMQAYPSTSNGSGYDYDADGYLLGFKLYGDVKTTEYFYNENGNEVKILTTSRGNSKNTYISYETYDDKNNLIERKYVYDNYSDVIKYEYAYNSNNKPIEVITTSGSEQYKYEYEYEAIRTSGKKIDQILDKCNLFMYYIP